MTSPLAQRGLRDPGAAAEGRRRQLRPGTTSPAADRASCRPRSPGPPRRPASADEDDLRAQLAQRRRRRPHAARGARRRRSTTDGQRDRGGDGARGEQHDPPAEGHGRGVAQDVADAAHGVQQPRLAAGLGLAPQVADVDLQRVGGGPEVIAPHAVEDLPAGEHLARVVQEQLEQQELRARQLDQPLAAAHLVATAGRARGRRSAGPRRSPLQPERRSSARSRASSSSSANGLDR